MNRPHSPSARFYANRQSGCPETFDTFPHLDLEQEYACQHVPSFAHFQGFSAPASHRYSNNICAGYLPDERVSPRTTVPYHDHQLRHLPRQRLERFLDESDRIIPTNCGSPHHCANSLVHTYQDSHNLSRARQLSGPPTHITPPPLYFSNPDDALTPHAERPVSIRFPPQEAPTGPLPVPVQYHVQGCKTIRVPSYSPSSGSGQQTQRLPDAGHTLASNEEGQLASSSDEREDDMPTIYPDDSTTTVSLSAVSPQAHTGGVPPRPLEEAVVEVHSICLAATQRYLESLRVNWELRQGNDILTQPGQAGPTRRLRHRACARSLPYPFPRRRRRALSDNSGLELMRGLRGADYTDDKEEIETRSRRKGGQPACPIPAPTDSLLENTSHICELVWRRSCRDREDILGAEAAATRKMALLIECAETVVLYDAAEWEGDPDRGFYAACRAGRDFCADLGDSRGVGRVEDIGSGEFED